MADESAEKPEDTSRTQFPHDDATLLFESPIEEPTQAYQTPDEALLEPTSARPSLEPTTARADVTKAGAGTMAFTPGTSQSSGTVRPGHVVLTPLATPAGGEKTRYTVTRLFAEGGLGKVWLASDRDLNREVVLKELRPAQARDPQILRRFVKEAQVTGQLEHPNIVPIYEMGKRLKDGRPFYTMRFVRGQTLRDLIGQYQEHRKQGKLNPLELPRLLSVFVSICNAIAYAHSRGVIHRDLKPANVAVGEFGEVIVLDWGLAKILDQSEEDAAPPQVAVTAEAQTEATMMGDVMGTPGYMAPEQAGSALVSDARTDIYGLGAILYCVLVGKPPHSGETTREVLANIARGDVVAARVVDPSVPAALSAICEKAMQQRPEDRYPGVAELAQDVERYLADEPVSAYAEPWWLRARRWVRKHRTLCLSAAAAAAVMLAGYGAWSWWDTQRVEQLRAETREFTRLGQLAINEGALSEAKQKFSQALVVAADEPKLADLHEDARVLFGQVQEQLREEEARQQAQQEFARFFELRDKALYHGTLFTGIDLAANVEAAKTAAAAALALFAGDPTAPQWRLVDEHHFTPRQREQLREAVYELWLVLADATAQPPLPGKPPNRNQAGEALAALDAAQRLGLTTRAFHLRKAQYLEQAGKAAAAREERQRAAEVAPSTALDHFLVGDALNKEGKLDEAMQHFQQALRLETDHFWSHYFLAVCHLKKEQFREAVAHLTAALTLRPEFGWTWLLRGYAYGHLDDYDSAEIDFQTAHEKGVDDYGLYVNRGVVRIRQGKLDEAAEDMRRAISIREDQYQAYVNLAVIYRKQGKLDEALEQLQRATNLAPEADRPYRARAEVHMERGDLDKALADYDRAVRFAVPGSASIAADQLERGRILRRLKRHREAIAAYDAAAQINPKLPNLHYLRADSLLALRRGDEALAALNRYLETTGTEPDAFHLRGFERAVRGDSAGALADYTRALELEPEAALVRARRGWAFLNTAAQLAFEDFDRAIELDPNNSDLYNGRGFARVMLGKYREGVADAEKALTLGPGGTQLKEKLALYSNAACILAQAAGRAVQDLSLADHEELADRYEQRAVELLKQAVDMLPEALRGTWLERTLADPAFDPIRHADGFRKLAK